MIETKKIIKAAVIGDPISHSLSPKIHRYFLQKYSINGSYEAIHLTKESLLSGVQDIINQGFAGFNVTIPHKEEIYRICETHSEVAKHTKAVNTVKIINGKLFGDNSDAEGFLQNLKKSQPDFFLKDKTAFVIGAGGASRAIIFALLDSGIKKIFLTNRNKERALTTIKDFSQLTDKKKTLICYYDNEEFCKRLDESDILINTTSMGMIGQSPLLINIKNIKKSSIVYDIVYKPLITELLNQAGQNENKIVTGIGMLIEQALVGFQYWFGIKPTISENDWKNLNF